MEFLVECFLVDELDAEDINFYKIKPGSIFSVYLMLAENTFPIFYFE